MKAVEYVSFLLAETSARNDLTTAHQRADNGGNTIHPSNNTHVECTLLEGRDSGEDQYSSGENTSRAKSSLYPN